MSALSGRATVCFLGHWAVALGLAAVAAAAPAEKAVPDSDSIVELERLRIAEKSLGRPFFYVEVPGFEILSPFNEKDTNAYVRELQRQRLLLTHLIPELAVANATPRSIILDDQPPATSSKIVTGRTLSMDEGVLRQSLDAVRGVPPSGKKPAQHRGQPLQSSSRAVGPDVAIFYTSVYGHDHYAKQVGNEVVEGDRAWSNVFPMASAYELRTPRWPAWVEDGVDTLGARFFAETNLQIFLLGKLSPPPAAATSAQLLGYGQLPEGVAASSRSEAACVLANWALSGPQERRDGFWKLAERATREPLSEEAVSEVMGSGAWDAVLMLWAEAARRQASTPPRGPSVLQTSTPTSLPVIGDVRLRRATRAELVRMKSEYEWRIGQEFALALPELGRQCLVQVGLRMQAAYDAGEREPRFLALFAMFMAERDPSASSRALVEEAAATKVTRPALYYRQARFRADEERARRTEGKFSPEQVRIILEPLRVARSQKPALGEVYQMMTEIWAESATPPDPDALDEMLEGTRLFPRDPRLLSNVALMFARAGNLRQAQSLLIAGLNFAPAGSATENRLRQMLAVVQDGLEKSKATR